ncbi:hypothetical protein D3C71_581000 [compost metagenome]
MSDLTKFSEGASILQQVDVSDIFKNLALGIAEAQQKLDDNSIAQAIKLAETKIGNESLLELGFIPVFYSFQYADISASIYLKMASRESLEFGFGLDLQLAKNKGYSEDTHSFLSEDNYSETTEEYKASRQLSFRAKEKKAVKINSKFVKQSESLDVKSRVEKFKYDIKHDAGVDQVYEEIQSRKLTENLSRGVDVWMDGGFLRIEEGLHFGAAGVGVFKIQDLEVASDVDIDGTAGTTEPIEVETEFSDATLNDAVTKVGSGAKVFALTKGGNLLTKISGVWVPVSSTMYFGFNSDEITYRKNLKDGSGDNADLNYPTALTGAEQNQNHNYHVLVHKALRLIQTKDPDASIKITGMTDPKGADNPKNKSLAKRRAENLRNHIFGSDAPVNVAIGAVTNSAGVSDLTKRYAKIELDADYLILIGPNVKKAAVPKGGTNGFVYVDDTVSPSAAFTDLTVTYGNLDIHIVNATFSTLVTTAQAQLANHSHEKTSEELHYSLDDEAIVKLTLLTNQSEEIEIENNEESTSQGTEQSSTHLFGKTKNQKSILNESVGNKSQDSSFALSASVDFRMSRQFEMSMEGNSSMSARMVSLPAPTKFVQFLEDTYSTGE